MTPPPNPEVALERAREALVEARDNTKLGHHRAAITAQPSPRSHHRAAINRVRRSDR